MTKQEAIEAYISRFGGFPFFSLRGAADETVIGLVETALTNDEPISIDFSGFFAGQDDDTAAAAALFAELEEEAENETDGDRNAQTDGTPQPSACDS